MAWSYCVTKLKLAQNPLLIQRRFLTLHDDTFQPRSFVVQMTLKQCVPRPLICDLMGPRVSILRQLPFPLRRILEFHSSAMKQEAIARNKEKTSFSRSDEYRMAPNGAEAVIG